MGGEVGVISEPGVVAPSGSPDMLEQSKGQVIEKLGAGTRKRFG